MWRTLPANVPLGVFWRARCRGSNETLPERGGIVLGGGAPAHSLAYGLRLGRRFENAKAGWAGLSHCLVGSLVRKRALAPDFPLNNEGLALMQVLHFQTFVTPTGFKPITF